MKERGEWGGEGGAGTPQPVDLGFAALRALTHRPGLVPAETAEGLRPCVSDSCGPLLPAPT